MRSKQSSPFLRTRTAALPLDTEGWITTVGTWTTSLGSIFPASSGDPLFLQGRFPRAPPTAEAGRLERLHQTGLHQRRQPVGPLRARQIRDRFRPGAHEDALAVEIERGDGFANGELRAQLVGQQEAKRRTDRTSPAARSRIRRRGEAPLRPDRFSTAAPCGLSRSLSAVILRQGRLGAKDQLVGAALERAGWRGRDRRSSGARRWRALRIRAGPNR